ncbi:PilZ domain-containing protein [Myxococcota bacterium]|nr:PilZ domain-containing protein [Myxococcota bacterium]
MSIFKKGDTSYNISNIAKNSAANSSSLHVTPSLVMILHNKRELLAKHLSEFENGGIFVQGHSHMPVGSKVWLDIALADERIGFQALAVVRWKRHRGTAALPAGIGVEFTTSEGASPEVLHKIFNPQIELAFVNRARRFHVRMPAELTLDDSRIQGITHNLSRTGVLIESTQALPIGTQFMLALTCEAFGTTRLEAEVVRNRNSRFLGNGIHLKLDNPNSNSKINKIIDVIGRFATAS